jgi:hypothetical protein
MAKFQRMHWNPQLDDDQVRDLAIFYRMALANVMKGKGSEYDVHTLACAANVCLVLAERGIGNEYVARVIEAQKGVVRAIGRLKCAWVGLDGPALVAIREMLDLHDEQLKVANTKDVREALQEVRNCMQAGDVFEVAA